MILVFALDEPDDIKYAYKQNKAYGIGYFYNKKLVNYPRAKKDEIICIIGHGNDKEIGNLNDDISITAKQLAAIIDKQFLPIDYQADIYIFSCHAAPQYIADFKKELQRLRHFTKSVFGFDDDVSYPIPAPGINNGWKKA